MVFHNTNGIYFGSQAPALTQGEKDNVSTSPIKSVDSENKQIKEISKDYSNAVSSFNIAKISAENKINFDTTPDNYVNNLIKQGKIPNKNFIVENYEQSTLVREFDSKGKRIKEVIFSYKAPVGCDFVKYYNPETQKVYKQICPHPGNYMSVEYNNPQTGERLCDETYSPDGTLMDRALYKKLADGEQIEKDAKSYDYANIDNVNYKINWETF